MIINNQEFPDNLDSSNKREPAHLASQVKFLHYCPRLTIYGREDQTITRDIKDIEFQYKKKVDEMVNQLLSEEKQTLNIIPKKANVDLKRALQPKLDKLKRRTEKSVVMILSSIHLFKNSKDKKFYKDIPKVTEKNEAAVDEENDEEIESR